MAGRHRRASGALVFKAIMEGGTLEEAEELRHIKVHKMRRQDRNLSAWMEGTVQKARLGSAPPLPVGFVATELSMLTPGDGRRQRPLPAQAAGRC